MFTAAFFTRAWKWKEPSWASTDERLMEICCISEVAGKWMDLEKIILSEVTQTRQDKHLCSLQFLAPDLQILSVAATPHQRSISLQQISAITENHTGPNAEINRSGLGKPNPKWIHLHHSSYMYGSGNMAEEKVDCKSQNTGMSTMKVSKKWLHKQDKNNDHINGDTNTEGVYFMGSHL